MNTVDWRVYYALCRDIRLCIYGTVHIWKKKKIFPLHAQCLIYCYWLEEEKERFDSFILQAQKRITYLPVG